MNFESGRAQMSGAGLRLDDGCTNVQMISVETRKRSSCGGDKTCDVVQTVGQEGTSSGGLQLVPGPGKGEGQQLRWERCGMCTPAPFHPERGEQAGCF